MKTPYIHTLRRTAALLAVSLCLGQGVSAVAETYIVKDGIGRAQILVGNNIPRTTRLAAEELQDVMEKITGVRLPVRTQPDPSIPVTLYVGRSAATDRMGVNDDGLKYGAYRVASGNDYLVLLGVDTPAQFKGPHVLQAGQAEAVMEEWDKLTGETWNCPMMSDHRRYSPYFEIHDADERGSMNAVYDFLRSLGCRWYYPGEIGEVLPEMTSIVLPSVNKTVKPDFPARNFLFYYHEFWSARPRLEEGIEDVRWQMRLGLFPYRPVLGPGLAHGSMAVHARPEVKATHPEYYALYREKRATGHLGDYGAGCLSSRGLLKQNVAYIRALFDIYDVPIANIGPADGYSLCQCPFCHDKGTPDQGWQGGLSDYVWEYTDRVARDVYKTHPDRYVSCPAYASYLSPPGNIDTFSPNVIVGFCYWRTWLGRPGEQERMRRIRQTWLDKIPSKKIYVYDYHRYNMPGVPYESVPVIFPHLIAEDMRDLKGISLGDHVEIYRNHSTHDLTGDVMASDHVNCYVHARLLWDADLDVDALLDDYYTKYYGPAAEEMKAFFEFAEANWMQTTKEVEIVNTFFELANAGYVAAGDGTVYQRRIQLLLDFMDRMKQLRARLLKGREDVPVAELRTYDKETATLDGKLDEPVWEKLPAYRLRHLVTGGDPYADTFFKFFWKNGALHMGITCREHDMDSLIVGAEKDGDMNVWQGDAVEILIETQTHAYYQLAVSPAGAVVDVDRKSRINTQWSSDAVAAGHRGEDAWTVEIRIPAAGDTAAQTTPDHGVSGRKPSKSYPWYFNVCRSRPRERGSELSAFSPTGKPDFHVPEKFAKMTLRW